MSNITIDTDDFDMELWSKFLENKVSVEPYWVTVIYVAAMLILLAVGIVGNAITCIIIYYDKTMHTATNYYLLNLAMSDMIASAAMTLEVYDQMNYRNFGNGRTLCKIQMMSIMALWNNSILIMTVLAIERYIAIWHPLLLKSTLVGRRVMKIIMLIWLVAIAETLPEIWTVDLITRQKSSICFVAPTKRARIISGVMAVLTFLIPLGIMAFVYAMIAFKVNVRLKPTLTDKIFNQRDNRSKVNKLTLTLTLSFLVCWLPYFVVRMIVCTYSMQKLLEYDEWWTIGSKFVTFNACFSVVLNPILFSLMSAKFRKASKILWNTKIKRRKQEMLKSIT